MVFSIFGRMTFTTTSWPFGNLALCTWAIDAEANTSASNRTKVSLIGRFKPDSIRASDFFWSNGGTWSCKRFNSFASSSESRSFRVESSCPNLMKIGPSSSSASLKRSLLDCFGVGKICQGAKKNSTRSATGNDSFGMKPSSRKRQMTHKIFAMRWSFLGFSERDNLTSLYFLGYWANSCVDAIRR